MTYETFKTEVSAAIAAINAASNGSLRDMPNTNYSIAACECASQITGADATLCKMFNRKFRNDAAALMFQKAA